VNRTQRLLLFALAAQIVILAVIHNPFSRASSGPKKLLPMLATYAPQKIEITTGDGASVTLGHAGGVWTLAKPPGYPADPERMQKLVQLLEHLTAGRSVARAKSSFSALKVGDEGFERRARIWTKLQDAPAATLYLGSPAGSGASHVRVAGSNTVVEAAGITPFDLPADAASWIDRKLVPLEASQVARLELSNKKGSFALARQGGVWRVEAPAARSGAVLDTTKVSELAQSLCTLSVVGPLGPADEKQMGLAPPVVRVSLTGADGKTAGYRIGAALPGREDSLYGLRDGSRFAVILSKYEVDRALDATIQGLLRK
jgi:hypothetical protein